MLVWSIVLGTACRAERRPHKVSVGNGADEGDDGANDDGNDDGWNGDPNSWPKDCDSFDPEKLYMVGFPAFDDDAKVASFLDANTILYRSSMAVAPVEDPTHVCPGFPVDAYDLSIRPSDGAIVFVSDAFLVGDRVVPQGLRVHQPDPFVYDAASGDIFVSPTDGWENDEVVANGCPSGASANVDIVLDPDSPDVSFTCLGTTFIAPNTVTAAGNEVLAHGYGDYALVREGGSLGELGILHDDAVIKLDRQWDVFEIFVRARRDGFLLAVTPLSGATQQVLVDLDGTTQMMGDYAAPPAPYSDRLHSVLDAKGQLWGIGSLTDGEHYAVYYRPLAPEESKIVYMNGDEHADFSVEPPRAYVSGTSARLFTGP